MIVHNDVQLQGLRRVGQLVANVLAAMQAHAQPDMSTAALDEFGGKLLAAAGAISAPQLCYDFPGCTCISINEQVAHGVPGERCLAAGDLVNIDVSAMLDGYFADTGGSFVLAADNSDDCKLKARLCRAASSARAVGIAAAHAGQQLNMVGRRIQRSIHAAGFRTVRNLCGHGVGATLHEEPTVRNYFDPRDGARLEVGQVMTIEPFLSTNVSRVHELADGWTLVGRPSSLFAQQEHTIVVTAGEPLILTLPL